MRGRALAKFLRAIDLLSRPSGATIEELGNRLAVDRRSVYRMLDSIEQLGFPIYDTREGSSRKKRWRFEDSYVRRLPNLAVPQLRLTTSEVVALFLLKCSSGLFKDTLVDQRIESAFDKLTAFLPDGEAIARIKGMRAVFLSSAKLSKDLSRSGGVIEDLTLAMLSGVTCRVHYHSFSDDRVKEFVSNPLHFFVRNQGLYLLTNRTGADGMRTLAVERIQSIELTAEHFVYPEGFDAENYLDSVFDLVEGEPINVAIHFTADQARYIRERKWSNSQRIADQSDGSVVLSMRVCGLWDVARWVLSWGSSATVLRPKALKQAVAQEARTVADRYSTQ